MLTKFHIFEKNGGGMQQIERSITSDVLKNLKPNKVLLLLGPRRVGKTNLVKQLAANLGEEKILQLNGEDMATSAVLSQRTVENYKRLLGNYTLLIIDEAQKIEDIGAILKLMVDEISGIKEFYEKFGDTLPNELKTELENLEKRLK
jgi:hypothetical protein